MRELILERPLDMADFVDGGRTVSLVAILTLQSRPTEAERRHYQDKLKD